MSTLPEQARQATHALDRFGLLVSCATKNCRALAVGGLLAAALLLTDVALAQSDPDTCRQGSGERAIAACNRAIAKYPRDASLHLGRGLQWIQAENYDRAIADLTEGMRLAPKRLPEVYNIRGSAWKIKGQLDKAIADFTEAIRINPKYVSAYGGRGSAWAEKRDYDRAIADYNEAIRYDPQYKSAYYNRGLELEKKQQLRDALNDFIRYSELDPSDA